MRWGRRVAWTDERLDDLSQRVEAGFARVDAELRGVNSRIDGVQQTMLRGFIATWVAMFTGFVGLAGLIVAHV
jgi:hypothetical protein